jgi:hypothetical protein
MVNHQQIIFLPGTVSGINPPVVCIRSQGGQPQDHTFATFQGFLRGMILYDPTKKIKK